MLARARAEDWLPAVADDSVQLIIVDPPYFRVMAEAWDRQWKTAAEYLDWLGALADEWRRVLAPNGSLYVFASPEMAARVEVLVIAERFEVLNSITWPKPDSINRRAEREVQRSYLCQSERILFAEHRGADLEVAGAAGYVSACEALKRRIFGDYLRVEVDRAGATRKEIAALFPSVTGRPTGCVSNWLIGYNCPTPDQWLAIREHLNSRGGEYLRREYEDLRRPFTVSADVTHADIWTYPTVEQEAGRHPCEKPLPMLRDMINASSRPGDLVLDCFSGRGSTWAACIDTGREFTGCEMDPGWVRKADQRAERHRAIRERRPVAGKGVGGTITGPLFEDSDADL